MTSIWSPDIEEAGTDQRVYPPGRDNAPLPEIVRTRLDAAMKVKKIEPAFDAAGNGRLLEAACEDQAASGKDLFEKLDDLVAKDKPKPPAKAAHELRKLRTSALTTRRRRASIRCGFPGRVLALDGRGDLRHPSKLNPGFRVGACSRQLYCETPRAPHVGD